MKATTKLAAIVAGLALLLSAASVGAEIYTVLLVALLIGASTAIVHDKSNFNRSKVTLDHRLSS